MREISRRAFLRVAALAAAERTAASLSGPGALPLAALESAEARLHVEYNLAPFLVSGLSWDTEGGERAKQNLLRPESSLTLRLLTAGAWRSAADIGTSTREVRGQGGVVYRLTLAPDTELLWQLTPAADRLTMTVSAVGAGRGRLQGVEMVFPFDPRVTPTTVLPSDWAEDGTLSLPAVLSAPDFGQMYLSDPAHPALKGRLEGSRERHTTDFVLELPGLGRGENYIFHLTPVYVPPPQGLKDLALWPAARRGWFNAWQPSSRWGAQDRAFSAPAGILANNVISDPASPSVWFYADQALWTPAVAPGISIAALVRRTVDWWLDKRTRPSGEVVGYWDYGNFLDANAGPLIAAWDYVEATGDDEWLARRIEHLEFISAFLARRDVDGDGMVEATQSGNRSTLLQPARSCAWWDALNCGHKDGYTNALTYRAWRCLADLEGRLGRRDQQARHTRLAGRLRASYAQTLYNDQTGWLAWWRSADGELHDYATPVVNGLAIEYGLVDPAQGRRILARLWKKIREAGFTRLELGVPPMLVPVHRSDYLLPDAIGCPKREDGTDTFGQYMNGGITAGQDLHFLAAHYVVGEQERADEVLRAMLGRQARGEFQNGVRDKGGDGIDWTTWDGKPSGYEGYLADSFRFLQAVLLREPSFRTRFYRPLVRSG